jgi:hypothetical protein
VAGVRIASQQLVSPPTDIDVSEDVVVTLRKVIHNSGPYGPVDVSISANASAPPDCTAIPDPANPTSTSLPVSANVVIDETWTIHCGSHSQHVFSFENEIAIEEPGVVDPNDGNNSASTQLTVDVWALADLDILDQYVDDPPAGGTIPVGENVEIWVETVVRNDGPFTPVDAEAETIVSWPDGCHLVDPPDGRHLERIRNLPVDVSIITKAPFTIRCDEPGQHTFSFDNEIRDTMDHVRDPNDGNNTAHTELTVTAS